MRVGLATSSGFFAQVYSLLLLLLLLQVVFSYRLTCHNTTQQNLSAAIMSFLSLPPEIRRIVYVFAFPSVRILIGTSSGEGSHEERLHHQLDQSDSWRGRRAARSLLLTCKTVSDEATAYLYSQPTFCFDSTVALNFFLDRTPLSSRAAVRSLEFVREFDMPGSSFKGEELATLEEACWCVAYVRANVDIPSMYEPI